MPDIGDAVGFAIASLIAIGIGIGLFLAFVAWLAWQWLKPAAPAIAEGCKYVAG